MRTLPLPATALMLLLASAAAQAQPTIEVHAVPVQEQATARSYWTRERLAAARPTPLQVDRQAAPAAAPPPALPSAGAARRSAPGRQAPDAERIARAVFGHDWDLVDRERALAAATELPVQPQGSSGVYTAYDVNLHAALWTIYPHIWSGRLNYRKPDGLSYSCSATSIGNNNIVTAAHCVFTPGSGFHNTFVFTPAYRVSSGGSVTAPYGSFPAEYCGVLSAWAGLGGSYSIDGWARHDVAICRMAPNAAGQTLVSAVGWAGMAWDAPYEQQVFNSGYPGRDYNNAWLSAPAGYLRACSAESFARTTDTMGSGCRYGAGISGGSWLMAYAPFVAAGWVNSVNSGIFVGQQNMYGPRFTSGNVRLLCDSPHFGC